jgi:hypothetical protein
MSGPSQAKFPHQIFVDLSNDFDHDGQLSYFRHPWNDSEAR